MIKEGGISLEIAWIEIIKSLLNYFMNVIIIRMLKNM